MLSDKELNTDPEIEQATLDIDATMGIMRSAIVCLHSLLKNKENVNSDLLSSHVRTLSSSSDLGVNNTALIVEQLPNLLFADHFAEFREKFIRSLRVNGKEEDAKCFEERLAVARSLPEEIKQKTRGIISILQSGMHRIGDFFDRLFSGGHMDNEHHSTQAACMELVSDYLANLNFHHHHHHHNVYATAITIQAGLYLASSGEPECADYPQAQDVERLNQRIQVRQAFITGVLDKDNHDYCWKFKNNAEQNLEQQCTVQEIDKIIELSGNCSNIVKRLPDVIALGHEFIIDFKDRRLNMVRVRYTAKSTCAPI